jgi:ABC-type transporter Mla subunit MlaD
VASEVGQTSAGKNVRDRVQTAAQKNEHLSHALKTGERVVETAKDVHERVEGVLEAVDDVQQVVGDGKGAVRALKNKDFKGALQGTAAAANRLEQSAVGQNVRDRVETAAANNENLRRTIQVGGKAIAAAKDVHGKVEGTLKTVNQVRGVINDAKGTVQAIKNQDIAGALQGTSAAANRLSQTSAGKKAKKHAQAFAEKNENLRRTLQAGKRAATVAQDVRGKAVQALETAERAVEIAQNTQETLER